ncbi:hypothetical protein J5N97_022929 [Dioscorea zingiberensis]|uniref:CCHC-type domain-containing protein n=1 Tax=Dioscorea zingiberensis TaxID=325984 RepID=A0A9D5HBA9_9LILI|nr:hypothetical protein J5N97_022929 [Dioscorea zingiberensis]
MSGSGLSGINNAMLRGLAKESSSISLQYPMLSRTNYTTWALEMKACLRAQGVWEAVEPKDASTRVEEKKDQMAVSAIYQAVPEDVLLMLAEKETAKEAWQTLKTMYLGAERVKKAKAQTLKTEFEIIRMKESETIYDFAIRLTGVVNQIRGLGETLKESVVVEKLLRTIPPRLVSIVSTIEQFGDLDTMTIEEVVGRLKALEEWRRIAKGEGDGHVLLTRAEWKAKEKESGKFFPSSSSKGRGRGGGRGRGRGEDGRDSEQSAKKFDKKKVKCYNCNHMGHFASECRSKKKDDRAYVAEKEDDDPSLLMAEACALAQVTQEPTMRVMLNEERVLPETGTRHESDAWYLDTGASNHMTGNKQMFTDLDESVGGFVKFGDDSAVEIKGRSTVLFRCLSGEHRALTDVYYIPRLRSNIVSLGQLEENGCRVVLEDDYLRIFDRAKLSPKSRSPETDCTFSIFIWLNLCAC